MIEKPENLEKCEMCFRVLFTFTTFVRRNSEKRGLRRLVFHRNYVMPAKSRYYNVTIAIAVFCYLRLPHIRVSPYA